MGSHPFGCPPHSVNTMQAHVRVYSTGLSLIFNFEKMLMIATTDLSFSSRKAEVLFHHVIVSLLHLLALAPPVRSLLLIDHPSSPFFFFFFHSMQPAEERSSPPAQAKLLPDLFLSTEARTRLAAAFASPTVVSAFPIGFDFSSYPFCCSVCLTTLCDLTFYWIITAFSSHLIPLVIFFGETFSWNIVIHLMFLSLLAIFRWMGDFLVLFFWLFEFRNHDRLSYCLTDIKIRVGFGLCSCSALPFLEWWVGANPCEWISLLPSQRPRAPLFLHDIR